MGNVFAELKRRHIYRVAAAYAVVAWVLIQLVNNVAPALRLPEWAPTLVIVLLFVGFPITLLIAWMRELAPADDTAARATTGKLDWVLIGALVVVIALVSFEQFTPRTGVRPAQQQQAASAQPAPSTATIAANASLSIAVLPFLNLSGDPQQEFFSDGMTEEITSALAKIPGLLVVGRTSAFQFKGQNSDLSVIGQALHASYLMEGSVREAQGRVRITAQLIRAGDGFHIWTDNYDGELKDIFATQETVARAIAGALRVPLGLKQGDTLVSNRTNDLDSYQQYLRARALVRARGPSVTDATALLEKVVARDPDYAPAWALLAQDYGLTPTYQGQPSASLEEQRRVVDALLSKAEAAARRAIELDPNLADGYLSLGLAQSSRGKLLLAEDLFKQALTLDPNHPDTLHLYGDLLADVGRLKEALVMQQHLLAVEPFVPVFNSNAATVIWLNGQNDAAIAIARGLTSILVNRDRLLARIYASMGLYSEAADAVLESPPGNFPAEDAARLLRTAPMAAASPQSLPSFWSFVYLYVGAPDRVLELHERNIEEGYLVASSTAVLWHPSYAPVRKTDRFKAYVRKAGFVDYWKARGWPDLCRPMGAEDFVCD